MSIQVCMYVYMTLYTYVYMLHVLIYTIHERISIICTLHVQVCLSLVYIRTQVFVYIYICGKSGTPLAKASLQNIAIAAPVSWWCTWLRERPIKRYPFPMQFAATQVQMY